MYASAARCHKPAALPEFDAPDTLRVIAEDCSFWNLLDDNSPSLVRDPLIDDVAESGSLSAG